MGPSAICGSRLSEDVPLHPGVRCRLSPVRRRRRDRARSTDAYAGANATTGSGSDTPADAARPESTTQLDALEPRSNPQSKPESSARSSGRAFYLHEETGTGLPICG